MAGVKAARPGRQRRHLRCRRRGASCVAAPSTLINEYLPFCECVEISNPPPTVPECRDPKDTPFLWLATRATRGSAHRAARRAGRLLGDRRSGYHCADRQVLSSDCDGRDV